MTEDEMVGWHTNSMDMGWSKLQGIVKDREAWRTAIHGAAESDTNQQLNNNSIKHIQLNLNSLFLKGQFLKFFPMRIHLITFSFFLYWVFSLYQ